MKTYGKKSLLFLSIVSLAACGNNDTSTDANAEEYESTRQSRQMEADTANVSMMNDMKKFASEAKSDGMMEVQMADIAMNQTQSQKVKDLASMIKSDHQKANEKLKKIAAVKSWDLPEQMLPKHAQKVAELRSSTGGAFDNVYLSMMEEGHTAAIGKFRKALGSTQVDLDSNGTTTTLNHEREESMPDASVANDIPKNEDAGMYANTAFPDEELIGWIKETLPVLQKHLKRTQELQEELP